MRGGKHSAETPRADCGLIHTSIDGVFIDVGAQNAESITERAETSDQAIPDVAIHPVAKERDCPAQSDDCVLINFIQPHAIVEEAKEVEPGERVIVGAAPIDKNCQGEADPNEKQ